MQGMHRGDGLDEISGRAEAPRRDKRTVQRKTGLEEGLHRRENEGRVIQRQG